MKIVLIIVFKFFLLNTLLFAQVKDAMLWSSINVEKKITSRVAFNFSQELRLNENISEINSFFSDLGLNYKINKNIRCFANYRFISNKNITGDYGVRNRFYVDLVLKEKLNKLIVLNRIRYQSQYNDFYSSENGKFSANYFREKLLLKFDLNRKLKPNISSEFFYRIGNNRIDNVRYALGFEYEIDLRNSVELSYLFQREYNVNNPKFDYITAIGYNFYF